MPADAGYPGLDVGPVMAGLTEKPLARFRDRAKVIITSGETTLPAASESFDRFISIYVLDILTENDIRALLAEPHRVLAPDKCIRGLSLCGQAENATAARILQ